MKVDFRYLRIFLLITSILIAVTAIGSGVANSIPIFVFFLILGGLAVGYLAFGFLFQPEKRKTGC